MRRDENGDITVIQKLTTKDAPLRGASGIAVSSDGSTVYVGAREDNAINIFSADSDGLLTLEHTVGDLEGLRWVNGVRLTPDGRFVVTVAVESSAISVFRVLHGDDDGCGGTCLR
jgi:6-phosphogluconolactonase (cycloisomerase 2 family)